MWSSTKHRYARLLTMSWREIASRISQAITKRLDLLFFYLPQSQTSVERPTRVGNFFFSEEDVADILTTLHRDYGSDVSSLIARARRICAHHFDLLGYESLDYGDPIRWHTDRVHDKTAPLKPWFRIPYLDFNTVGDVKVTWELNRHQHLVTLARAYRLSGNQEFATELVRQWYDWRRQNPYPLGVNWASSLEVAFRSLSWMWIWFLLQGSPHLPPEFYSDLYRAIVQSCAHIEKYLSTYFSPNTHLLGEAVALFFAGTLFPSHSRAKLWQTKGWSIVCAQTATQVLRDGMHFEQTTYYHVYALDFFLHARMLAVRNGVRVPPEYDRAVNRMLEVLRHLTSTPAVFRFGDDDGGRVFDPARNRPEHLRDPLATGAIVYSRPDLAVAAGYIPEETLWLAGAAGKEKFENMNTSRPPTCNHIALAGGACLSADNRIRVLFDAAPLGVLGAGHGHADALSVQVHANGAELLTDPGTFAYITAGRERQAFRGAAMHNTVTVDDSDQACASGPFSWKRLPSVQLLHSVGGSDFSYFRGVHDGYSHPAAPVEHCRSVFHLRDRLLFVADQLTGQGSHTAELKWQVHPSAECRRENGRFILRNRVAEFALAFAPNTARILLEDSWYSPVYGVRVPSQAIRATQDTDLPVGFATVIAPEGSLVCFQQLEHHAIANADAYAFVDDSIHLFLVRRGVHEWAIDELATDAAFLYYCQKSTSRRLYLLGVTRVAVRDQQFTLRAESNMEYCSTDKNQLSADLEQVIATRIVPIVAKLSETIGTQARSL